MAEIGASELSGVEFLDKDGPPRKVEAKIEEDGESFAVSLSEDTDEQEPEKVENALVSSSIVIPRRSFGVFVGPENMKLCECGLQQASSVAVPHLRYFVKSQRVTLGECRCGNSIAFCARCRCDDMMCRKCFAVQFGVEEARMSDVDFTHSAVVARLVELSPNPNHTRSSRRQARRVIKFLAPVLEEDDLDRSAYGVFLTDEELLEEKMARAEARERNRRGYAFRLSTRSSRKKGKSRKDDEFFNSFGNLKLEGPFGDTLRGYVFGSRTELANIAIRFFEGMASLMALFMAIPEKRPHHWIAFLNSLVLINTNTSIAKGAAISLVWFSDYFTSDEAASENACLMISREQAIVRVDGVMRVISARKADGTFVGSWGDNETRGALKEYAQRNQLYIDPVICRDRCLAERGSVGSQSDDGRGIGRAEGSFRLEGELETFLTLTTGGFKESRAGKRMSLLLSASTFLPFVMMAGGDRESFTRWYTKRIADPMAIFHSLSLFFQILTDVVTSVLPWMITGEEYFLYPEQSWQPWYRSVNEFLMDVSSEKVNEMSYSEESLNDTLAYADRLIKMSTSLQTRFIKMRDTSMAREVNLIVTKLQTAKREISANYVRTHSRIEPIVVFLHSAPGQGKTPLMNMILSAVSTWAEWPRDDVYYTLKGSWNWEKYNGQKMCVVDELGAENPQMFPQELQAAMLDMVGTNPVETRQAFDKGEKPFKSEFIVCASNKSDGGFSTVLTTPKAMGRRLRYRVVPKLNPRYVDEASGAMISGVNFSTEYDRVWNFDVYIVNNNTTSSLFEWTPLKWDVPVEYRARAGVETLICTSITYDQFFAWLECDFKMRRDHAQRVFASSKDPNQKIWCDVHHCVLSACVAANRGCQPRVVSKSYELPDVTPLVSWRDVFAGRYIRPEGQCCSCSGAAENAVARIISRPPVRTAITEVITTTTSPIVDSLKKGIDDGTLVARVFTSLVDHMTDRMRHAFANMPWLKVVVVMAGVVGGLKLVQILVSTVAKRFGAAEGPVEDLAAQVPEPRPFIPRKDYYWAPAVEALKQKRAQSSQYDKFVSVVNRNVFVFSYSDGLVPVRFQALGLGGNLFVTNRHIFGATATARDVVLIHGDREYRVAEESFYFPPDYDLAFFLAQTVPLPDLTRYIGEALTQKQIPVDMVMLLCYPGEESKQTRLIATDVCRFTGRLPDGALFSTHAVHGVCTSPTKPGNCGSPYYSVNELREPLLFGIHGGSYGGGDDVKVSMVPLTKDLVTKAREKLHPVFSLESEVALCGPLGPLHKSSIFQWAPNVQECIIGSEEKGAVSKLASNLVRTDFSEELAGIPKKRAPVFKTLRVNDEYVNSYVTKVNALMSMDTGYDEVLYRVASAEYFDSLKHLDWDHLTPLTVRECLVGTPGELYSRRMPQNTSAGWPRGTKGQFISDEGDILDPVASEIVRVFRTWKDGARVGIPFYMSLKDEPVSDMKMEAGRIRVFLVPPLHYIIISKMVLAPVFALLRADPGGEACIGMNVYGPDFERFLDRIRWKGHDFQAGVRIMDADFAWWDLVNLVAFVLRLWFEFLSQTKYGDRVVTFGDEEITVREILLGMMSEEFVKHTVCCLVHMLLPGYMGSGVFGTAELNSIIVAIVLRAIFLVCKLSPDLQAVPEASVLRHFHARSTMYSGPDWFRREVRAGIYGDDNAQGVLPSAQGFYNPQRYKIAGALLGFTVTDSRKSQEMAWKDWKEILFLKRTPVLEDGRVLAALEHDSIMNMLQWRDASSPLTKAQMHAVLLVTARREFFYHGRAVFDKWDAALRAEAERLGIIPLVDRYWYSWEVLAALHDRGEQPELDATKVVAE